MGAMTQNENGHFIAEAVDSGAIWQGELDRGEFIQKYKPIRNELDPNTTSDSTHGMFREIGQEHELIKATNHHHLWSYLDGEFSTFLSPGLVGGSDRLGCYITEVPWTNEKETVLLSVKLECVCFNQELFDDGDDAGDPDCERCLGSGTLWTEVSKPVSPEIANVAGAATTTLFLAKAQILADLWMEYRDHESFKSFVNYNDLGLPLAYCYANSIVTEQRNGAIPLIEEAFRLLLELLGLQDVGYQNLDEVLEASGQSDI